MRSSKRFLGRGEGVLITGCSSGIGRATAVHLAQRGFTTLATVRRDTDVMSLRSLNEPNLVPLWPLDLTKLDQIPALVEAVAAELRRRGKDGLYALINNAGGGEVVPVELMDLEKFHIELQARVLGSVAMVKAFLPMIRQANGRIIWIMTPATIPTPYVTGIHACDFAVNCIARTLEIELKPWKIPNIMIRCGGIQTESVSKSAAELESSLRNWPRERFALYEAGLRQWKEDMVKFDEKRTPPEDVAKIILEALRSKKPKRRYSVGHMAKAARILELLPQRAVDKILKKRF
jgi:NAD(P)-dependent dehydrogenase (short-subunit alcohol dehydrogenase family)